MKGTIQCCIDRYSIAVLKDDTIVGHIPKKVSRICFWFIARGGAIACTPNGGRRYSVVRF